MSVSQDSLVSGGDLDADPAGFLDSHPDDPDSVPSPPSDQEPSEQELSERELTGAVEAVLLVVDSPVTELALAQAIGVAAERIFQVLRVVADRLTAAGSGIDLRQTGGGWRFYTRDVFAPVVERFVLDGASGRLSKAALETLAVIAYRQPVTRSRIAGIRGVNVDGVVRTLTSRGLVEEAGTDLETGAMRYATTELFLDRLGLTGLDELPSLGPLLPDIDGFDDE